MSIRCVVIGLGNPLMGDDGLGLAMLARLEERWHVPDEVELVDGGTWGMQLLPTIEGTTRLLLLDAVRTGAPAGTPVVLGRDQIPRYLSMKLSPHQLDLRETLAVAELRGTLPGELVAIGMEPDRIELSDVLSPLLAVRLDEVVDAAVRLLASWGYRCRARRPGERMELACTR